MLGFCFMTVLDDLIVSGDFSTTAGGVHSRQVGDSGQKMHTKMMGMGQICEISKMIAL